MTYRVSLSDLAPMTPEEREAELAALVRAARSDGGGSARTLGARIRGFELSHGMSSDELLAKLRAGEVEETAEISDWLFWLDAQNCRVPG